MKRRDFLQLCGATAGAYAIGSLARAGAPTLRPPRRLVAVFLTGGWDTCYAVDPKDPAYSDVPAGAVQMFEGLDVFCDASRPSVTGFFAKYAGVTAIARGVCTDAINHNECQRRIATGTREETRPDFGAIIAHELGNGLPLPYLILGDTAWTGPYAVSAGRVGTSNQIVDLLDPGSSGPPTLTTGAPVASDGPSDAEQALLRDYAAASAARARAIRGAAGYNRKRVDDFVEAIDRGERLRALRAGFGKRGETLSWDSQIGLALDALEHDLSHAVMISTRLVWDTHSNNYLQGEFHDTTFRGLTRLVDELSARPGRDAGHTMLDDTVVAVFSELSRTPRLGGSDPTAGKGHWPITSALVIGGGVRGGRVFGATAADNTSMPIDLATGVSDPRGVKPLYSHFVAGVLALCGVDPSAYLDVPVFDAFAV